MKRCRSYLFLTCCWPLLVLATENPGDGETGSVAREDLQEVLAAFAEAGLEGYMTGTEEEKEKNSPDWGKGRLSLWHSFQGGESVWQGRVRLALHGLNLRAKVRQGGVSSSAGAVALGWQGHGWQVRTGGMGFSAGYGLLLADAGRRGGLAAGSSFATPRVRLRGWSSSPEERSVFGVGLQGCLGSWCLTVMQGAPGQNRPGSGYAALALERRADRVSWALSGVQAQGLRGLSFSGLGQGGGLRLGWELSGRQDSPETPVAMAWLVGGRWDPLRALRAEIQVAGSTCEQGPWTGTRPALLKVWGGGGWAARLKASLGRKLKVALLLAQSRGSRMESQARRYGQDTGEVMVHAHPASGWTLRFRGRSRRERKWAWSAEHPWLPAELVDESPLQGLLVQVEQRRSGGWWRMAWRRLEKGSGRERERRSLLEWKGRRLFGPGWSLTLHQMWAWGQDVDLVTAITPVPGMVRPRHWGKWAEETVLAVARERGKLLLAVGLSRRIAGRESGLQNDHSIWLHAKVFW